MENPFAGMDPDAMLHALKQEADQLESKARKLQDELAAASATVSSPDGAVTVTLSQTGALQNISFSDKATNHRPDTLGALVMKTVQTAQRAVSERVAQSVSEQFDGADTMNFVRQYMPQAPPDPARGPDADLDEGQSSIMRKHPGRRA